jgi:hypothetical protein
VVGRSRNCSEPFARLRDPGGSSHSVAQLLCGLDDRLSLCRESYVLARISSKCRCAKRECEDDAYVSDRPAAQATWSAYCFHALIVMRLRISRKLIRHLRAQCFARDSLKFEKLSQFFVGGDDESLSVVAVCVSNPDYGIAVAAGGPRFLQDQRKARSVTCSNSGSSRIRFRGDLASHSRAFCRSSEALRTPSAVLPNCSRGQ